ncbi:hypothetical protein K490DRAFT_66762 [Saccharata proteae CBS 121410]|uniref:Uncharacterized protein n=1 Tax=Saccharata proteae CBS 121410 TaxID=1314787 RepID=A0A9P4HQU0_9PEZI|nr:hypothetical protein K490DRAFT_66762 [Saccharata proteae CBS 121410]
MSMSMSSSLSLPTPPFSSGTASSSVALSMTTSSMTVPPSFTSITPPYSTSICVSIISEGVITCLPIVSTTSPSSSGPYTPPTPPSSTATIFSILDGLGAISVQHAFIGDQFQLRTPDAATAFFHCIYVYSSCTGYVELRHGFHVCASQQHLSRFIIHASTNSFVNGNSARLVKHASANQPFHWHLLPSVHCLQRHPTGLVDWLRAHDTWYFQRFNSVFCGPTNQLFEHFHHLRSSYFVLDDSGIIHCICTYSERFIERVILRSTNSSVFDACSKYILWICAPYNHSGLIECAYSILLDHWHFLSPNIRNVDRAFNAKFLNVIPPRVYEYWLRPTNFQSVYEQRIVQCSIELWLYSSHTTFFDHASNVKLLNLFPPRVDEYWLRPAHFQSICEQWIVECSIELCLYSSCITILFTIDVLWNINAPHRNFCARYCHFNRYTFVILEYPHHQFLAFNRHVTRDLDSDDWSFYFIFCAVHTACAASDVNSQQLPNAERIFFGSKLLLGHIDSNDRLDFLFRGLLFCSDWLFFHVILNGEQHHWKLHPPARTLEQLLGPEWFFLNPKYLFSALNLQHHYSSIPEHYGSL